MSSFGGLRVGGRATLISFDSPIFHYHGRDCKARLPGSLNVPE